MTSVIKAATTRIYGTATPTNVVTGKIALVAPVTHRRRSVFLGFYADNIISIGSVYTARQTVVRLFSDDELVSAYGWTWGGAENFNPGLPYLSPGEPLNVGTSLLVPSFTLQRLNPETYGEAPTTTVGPTGEMVVVSLNEGDESRTMIRMQPLEIYSDAKELRAEIETTGGTTQDFLFVALGFIAHPF